MTAVGEIRLAASGCTTTPCCVWPCLATHMMHDEYLSDPPLPWPQRCPRAGMQAAALKSREIVRALTHSVLNNEPGTYVSLLRTIPRAGTGWTKGLPMKSRNLLRFSLCLSRGWRSYSSINRRICLAYGVVNKPPQVRDRTVLLTII